jgi:hypothetical protein
MKYTKQVLTLVLLIGVASSYAQYNNDTYTVNITGVSCITLLGPDYQETYPYGQETTPFNYENNLGKYYPDNDGAIHIELKRGYYEYVTGRNGMNGSFYITTRNVYFNILELDHLCGIDSRKLLYEAHRCLSNNKERGPENCSKLQQTRVTSKQCLNIRVCAKTGLEEARTRTTHTIT